MDQQQRGPEESDELAYLSGEACESPANTSTKRMDKQTEQKTTWHCHWLLHVKVKQLTTAIMML